MSETIRTGGCQCGAVRYEIQAEPLTLYVCHCRDCQRQSGSGFGMSLPVPRESLVLLSGQPHEWRRRAESGREVVCQFCGDCGTRLFHLPSRNPKVANVKPGTLDDTGWLEPVGQLWTSRRQPWVQWADGAIEHETQPPDFEVLLARWRQR